MLTIKPKDDDGYIWLVTGSAATISYNDIFDKLINVNYYRKGIPEKGTKIITGKENINGPVIKKLEAIYHDPEDDEMDSQELWYLVIKKQTKPLYIKSEVHYISILDDVFLALYS
ncbi:MAG: hypothetical protein M9887_05590 [Chitinophagales bacterium]|nr:hypothetical protein [Chitinophagales bacterium]